MAEQAIEERSGGGAFIALFLVPWTLLVLIADGGVAFNSFRQIRALGFASTQGRVLQCRLEPVFQLEYAYTVDRVAHTGRRYRYFGLDGPQSRESRQALVDLVPAQAPVTVFYDPADPTDALLKPGLTGAELFLMTCLSPFNAAALLGWAFVWIHRRNDPPFDMRFSDDGTVARARLDVWMPLFRALFYAGGMGFALCFVVGLPTGGDAPVPIVIASWIAVVGAGIFGWRRADSNRDEIVIDRTRRTVTLPKHDDRRQPLTVDSNAIAGVEVRKTTIGEGHPSYVPFVIVRSEDGERSEEPIMSTSEKAAARHLTRWLKNSLGLQEPSGSHKGL